MLIICSNIFQKWSTNIERNIEVCIYCFLICHNNSLLFIVSINIFSYTIVTDHKAFHFNGYSLEVSNNLYCVGILITITAWSNSLIADVIKDYFVLNQNLTTAFFCDLTLQSVTLDSYLLLLYWYLWSHLKKMCYIDYKTTFFSRKKQNGIFVLQ